MSISPGNGHAADSPETALTVRHLLGPRPRTATRQDKPAKSAARHGRRATAAAALLTLTASAGCASATDISTSPRTATPAPSTEVSQLHLPIEQFMLTPAQSIQVAWLQQAATGACMRRYGQTYPVPPKPGTDDPALAQYTVTNRRYGITDPNAARTWGYHVPQAATGPTPTRPLILGALPATARTVLTGLDPATGARVSEFAGTALPEHGCLGELERVLPQASGGPAGPGNGPDGVVTTIKARSFTDSMATPALKAATTAWSHCMMDHGFTVDDPPTAPDHIASMRDQRPGGDEIAQAEADVSCKRDTNVAGIWYATEATLQNKAIAEHARDLAQVKAQLEAETTALPSLLGRDWTSPQTP